MKNFIFILLISLIYSCTLNSEEVETLAKFKAAAKIDSIARVDSIAIVTEIARKKSLNCLCDSSVLISNTSSIEGYTDEISYFPGDTINLYINSQSKLFNIKLKRQSIKSQVFLARKVNNGIVQNYNQCSYRDGCDWMVTNRIIVPKNTKSGYFTIHLSSKHGEFSVPIIVKSKINNDILCVASTNTWHAYNRWGGASFYNYSIKETCKTKTSSTQLSFQRPLDVVGKLNYQGHLFDAELALLHWLEKEKIRFDVLTDKDIHDNPKLLQKYSLVMLNTHNEYWTEESLDGIDDYLDLGGSLAYLGANGLYWKVTIYDDVMECQKQNRIHQSDSTKGGKWISLGRPEAKTIGVSYSKPGYNTYMPYVVVNDNHWIFENTGLRNGDLFGASLNRKYASGHETDKTTKDSPENLIILARGVNQEAKAQLGKIGADRNGGANMIFYEHKGGGFVFSTGSITSSGSPIADTSMSVLMKNLIKQVFIKKDSTESVRDSMLFIPPNYIN
jgi:N,N-dimethylformamidase